MKFGQTGLVEKCGQREEKAIMKKTSKKSLIVSLMILGLTPALLWGGDPDQDAKENRKEDKIEKQVTKDRHVAVLGVSVDDLHPAFSTQMPETIAPGQGVIVADVTDDSPADKVGVELHDILVMYDDQKIFNADQLTKLVRSDTPGRDVTLGLVRSGKLVTVNLTLGDQVVSERIFRRGVPYRGTRLPMFRWWGTPWVAPWNAEEDRNHWKNFDSLSLKSLGDGKYSASIYHTDPDGKTQKHTFEGTREEIRKQIEADKDMNDYQRGHLLNSLNLGAPEQWDEEFLHPDF